VLLPIENLPGESLLGRLRAELPASEEYTRQ